MPNHQIDHRLLAIARAAEAGEECPPVRLLTDGHMLTGKPGSWDLFRDGNWLPLVGEMQAAVGKRPKSERKDKPVSREEIEAHALQLYKPMDGAPSEDGADPTALSLIDVTWGLPSGEVARVPAMRVALSSVAAWWVAGVTPVNQQDRGGGGWFVGGVFPIPDL